MDRIPLMRASALSPYVEVLRELGAEHGPLLARVRLPVWDYLRPDALISCQQLFDFAAASQRAIGLRDYPLWVARRSDIGGLGAWGRLLAQAKTLGEFCEMAVGTSRLHSSGTRWWFAESGSEVWLCQQFDRQLAIHDGDALIPLIGYRINSLRRVLGPAWSPREITLAAPISLSLEGLGIDAPVRVSGLTSVPIPRRLLGTPTPRIAAMVSRGLGSSLEPLAESAPASDFLPSVRQALLPLARASEAEIHVLAEIAHLSVRTLQRRLADAGTSFRGLVQEVRFVRALQQMEDPARRLTDIAFALGFSDPAHFTRAFRRWAGVSPLEYRRAFPNEEGASSRWAENGTSRAGVLAGERIVFEQSRTKTV